MKKLIIFGSVIVVIFAALVLVTNMQQSQESGDNVYNKSRLDPATVDQLDDPNYQNIVLPEELEEKIENEEDATVYFFSPKCQYCQEVTPRLMPIADDMNVNLLQYNLLEFEQGWNDFNVDSTPTLVQYKDGEEVFRIVGAASNEDYQQFFESYTLNEE
ncbi:thioredoxin family protein [Alkalihalobacillus trypoxylicola]|uniref:Thioredoxin n=1 Tax=Alkalihalobacillus trypoxylicola TaxID=519424 RepID=A0A161QAH8_9BACI|nr:thioredoxin family protein [Alkalihalobacillus trypoxylicola]KYG34827.1 thioredoxin [Alkalihalobacillus trypoxylicola]GAF64542.1 thioredoxin [Bacillus sp. TS-2]